MMKSADAALLVIGNLVTQAAARGDTAGMLEHLAVYLVAVKAARRAAERQRAGE